MLTTRFPSRAAVRIPLVLMIASSASALSLAISPTYDEVYWLGTVRRITAGAVLYKSALDQKGPLFYLVVAALDRLPGSYVLARALAIGLLVAIAIWLLLAIGSPLRLRSDSTFAIVVAVIGMALATKLALTVEVVAAPLVLTSFVLAARKPGLVGLTFLLATAVDPRTLLFAPPALLLPRVDRRRLALSTGMAVVVVVLTLFLWDDFRFALLELGGATRFASDWILERALTAFSIQTLPLVVILVASKERWRFSPFSFAYMTAAATIGFGSLAPFDHYWLYWTLIPGLLQPTEPVTDVHLTMRRAAAIALIAFSFLPSAIHTVRVNMAYSASSERWSGPIALLDTLRHPGDRILNFSLAPDIAAAFPDASLGRSPTVQYLLFETSRSEEHRAEFIQDLGLADFLVIERPLNAPPPTGAAARYWNALVASRSQFPCSWNESGIWIYGRAETCGRGG